MAQDAPGEQIIVDEEVPDTGLLPAEDSEASGDGPTGEGEPTTAKTDPDPLSEEGEEEELEEELPTAGKPAAKPGTPAAGAPEKKAPVTPEPFKYTGDKKEHVLEGAQYYAGDGLYIPESQVPKVKQLLAAAAVHNGSWQARERQYATALKEAREGRTEKDVAADALMDLVFKDLGSLKTDDDVFEWALNFRQNLPNYKLEIERKKLDHERAQFRRSQEPSPEEREEQYSSVASDELSRTLDEIFQMPEMKVLDAEDQKELRSRFTGSARRYLTEAPSDQPQHDIKKGDLIFDGAALLDQVRSAATIKSRTVSTHTAAQKAAEANRRKVGAGTPSGARVPAGARSSGTKKEEPAREEGTGRFKSRAEYEEWARSDAE